MVLNIKFRRGRQSSRAIRAQAGSGAAGGRRRAAAGGGSGRRAAAGGGGGGVSIPRRLQSAFVERRAAPSRRRAGVAPPSRPAPRHRHSTDLSPSPANSNDLFSLTNVALAPDSRRDLVSSNSSGSDFETVAEWRGVVRDAFGG